MTQELSGVRADRGYSYRKLEEMATNVRVLLNHPPTEAINTLRLFDGLEIKGRVRTGQFIPIQGGVIEIKDSEGFSKFDSDRSVIEILASLNTYSWLEKGYPRAGYFVAHELGHCLLHTDQLIRLAQLPTAQKEALHRGGQMVAHKVFQDTEWQANAFASALLMPARGIYVLEQKYNELSPAIVAEHFHVSDESATYRVGLFNARKQQLL